MTIVSFEQSFDIKVISHLALVNPSKFIQREENVNFGEPIWVQLDNHLGKLFKA